MSRATLGITVILALVLGGSAPGPSAAGTVPDAASLLAASKRAAGGEAWDEVTTIHSRVKMVTGGLEGEADTW